MGYLPFAGAIPPNYWHSNLPQLHPGFQSVPQPIFAPPPYPSPGYSGSNQGTSSVVPATPKLEHSYMASEARSTTDPQILRGKKKFLSTSYSSNEALDHSESSPLDWPTGSVRREAVKGEEDHKWKHNKWAWRSNRSVQHEGHAAEQRACLGVFDVKVAAD